MEYRIDILHDPPADELAPLAEQARRTRLGDLPELLADWQAGRIRLGEAGQALILARAVDGVVGACALCRDAHADNPAIGRMRGFYVASQARGHGVGRALLRAIRQAAQGRFREVRTETDCPILSRFFETFGFEPVTGLPGTTHRLQLGTASP